MPEPETNKMKLPPPDLRVLKADRERICDEIDAYVKKTAILYVPIEVLKAIVHNVPPPPKK